jgi:hypothetical protein
MEERLPVGVIRTADGKKKIVSQERNESGHLHKLGKEAHLELSD